MKIMVLAFLLMSAAAGAFAQTTAEEFYNAGYLKMGNAYGKEGAAEAADAAIADFTSAIRLKPDHHEAYNFRANMKLKKGDLDGALSDYSKAIELNPKFGTYYSNRASAREKKNDIKGALADMGQAITFGKDKFRNYLFRGEIRLRNKEYAAAIADFNKSLQLKPDFYASRRPRAEAYRALGKNDLAAADEKIVEEEDRKMEAKLFEK